MAKDIKIYGKVKAQETMLVLPVPQVLRGDMVISDVNGERPSLSLWGVGSASCLPQPDPPHS